MPPLIILRPYEVSQQTYLSPHSLRFSSANASYMSRTPAGAGNVQTWTMSCWVKRGTLGTASRIFNAGYITNGVSAAVTCVQFTATDNIEVFYYNGTTNTVDITTSAVLRDCSSWYHIVVSVDTTQTVVADRVRIYINGVLQTAFATATYPSQNFNTTINSSYAHSIGRVVSDGFGGTGWGYFDGHITEMNLVDGQFLSASDFGVTEFSTGQWKPIVYTGTYGTNGFYLPFTNGTSTTTLGYDTSGNSNHWTLTGFSVVPGATNSWLSDTPSNNYCILNPLQQGPYLPTINNGGLNASGTYGQANATMAVSTGKWYFEYTATSIGAQFAGVGIEAQPVTGSNIQSAVAYSYLNNGNKYVRSASSGYGATWTINDIIGVAFDLDNHTIEFFKNGVSQGIAASDITAGLTYSPTTGGGGTSGTTSFNVNFGQRSFAYAPPTGFQALNTNNLPVPTIENGTLHFNAVIWTGTGTGATRSVSGVGFAPDMVWAKSRGASRSNLLYDISRGAGANSELVSDTTVAEGGSNPDTYDYLSSFDADGFTSTWSGSNFRSYFNNTSEAYVAWNWKANGTPVTNNDGAITSQVSANTTAGFSIVTFTGNGATSTSVGHGLGIAPKLYMIAPRNATGGFAMVHILIDGTVDYMFLNSTNGNGNATQTVPTSTTFNVRADAAENVTGRQNVVYCFAEIPGYSKFGKYTGNGNANGPFVYCGFKPRYVMVKRADASGNWVIVDAVRDVHNVEAARLWANLPNAESVANPWIDLLSNGFKIRDTSTDDNASNGTYVFLAFAEASFKYSTAR